MHTTSRTVLLLSMTLLGACSSGSDSGSDDGEGGGQADDFDVIMAPAGVNSHYGAVTIADDAGQASDLVGSFYRLASGVSAEFMNDMLSGSTTQCQVQDDGVIDFEEISAGYIPTVPGIGKSAVSAGTQITLSTPDGIHATLQEQPAAGFLFYDLPDMSMLAAGPVPAELQVDVPGSSEIPAIAAAAVPEITTLTNTSFGDGGSISATTRFSWDASGDPRAMIRIFSSTAGGFFLEDGVTVSCVTPDTGSFTFPASVRAELGQDFTGSEPLMSRIVVNPVQVDSTVLYIVRESFR